VFASYFRAGDEVAVLPHERALPSDLLEIATIEFANSTSVQLADRRKFAALGGAGLNTNCCIVPARTEHRAALTKRSEQLIPTEHVS
jgi:hypothetical protein